MQVAAVIGVLLLDASRPDVSGYGMNGRSNHERAPGPNPMSASGELSSWLSCDQRIARMVRQIVYASSFTPAIN
jgi:hypothetical protein